MVIGEVSTAAGGSGAFISRVTAGLGAPKLGCEAGVRRSGRPVLVRLDGLASSESFTEGGVRRSGRPALDGLAGLGAP